MKTIKTKIHRLPTEKGLIYKYKPDGKLYYNTFFPNREVPQGQNTEPQHLYITTDEEIKEGDWFINTGSGGHPTPKVYQANSENSKAFKEFGPYPEIRKIIATTDPKLTVERYISGIDAYGEDSSVITRKVPFNIPQIPQLFIEAYCKAGGIDEVLVEMKFSHSTLDCHVFVPKLNPDNTIIIHPVEEKMYSREEIPSLVVDLCRQYQDYKRYNALDFHVNKEDMKKWIEEKLNVDYARRKI